MKVYVLCGGSYSQRDVVGVFTTLEEAQARFGNKYEWKPIGKDNDYWVDGSPDGADIQAFELQGPVS